MKHACSALALAALLAAGPLLADDKPEGKAMAPPKAAPQMAQLSYLTGTWNCAGKTFANPFGPEHATAGVVQSRMSLNGFLLEIHYDENKTAANPMPYHALQVVGFQGAHGMFVSSCFDSMGGTCEENSSGWKGDALVFEGSGFMMGQKSGARDTFTKVSATELKHKGEFQGADGKWTATDEETCKRPPKAGKK
jgi:hypothetical protein